MRRAALLAIVSCAAWVVPGAVPGAAAQTQPAAAIGGKLSFVRLYTSADGASHFSNEELPLKQAGTTGILASLAVSRIGESEGVMFAQLKAGTTEDWHIAPKRQLMVCVRGLVEVTASDGEKRRLAPGQFMLLEDTTGKGHVTHVLGTEDHVALAVQVPDGALTRN